MIGTEVARESVSMADSGLGPTVFTKLSGEKFQAGAVSWHLHSAQIIRSHVHIEIGPLRRGGVSLPDLKFVQKL